jgi:hypothetical protein
MQLDIQSNRTGRLLRWVDGQWSGDPEWVEIAKQTCHHRQPIALTPTGPIVEADASDPVSVVAVLSSVVTEPATLGGDFPPEVDEAFELELGAVG